ncbi:L,D-transpeptidase family protein [Altererythrobacter litoralis]|uniref:L,D-transpeptidase family protein n=1 Tax=Altererythrobacter litoralis TaxID=3113904 RepID=A0ABU7GDJ1_9SPHN|nr:L,D-transpeptidase family protein [Erythrobacteraceae bacterium 1XM1-14]
MKRSLIATIALLIWTAAASAQVNDSTWSSSDITTLKRWVDSAPLDALPRMSSTSLDRAVVEGDQQSIDDEATMLALRLARAHLLGSATQAERAGWNIVDSDREIALEPMLERAVEDDTLDTFFALLRPAHADYSALKTALANETDADRRKAIARNMERWRWMPRSLGSDYVLVNPARFEADLWRDGAKAETWRVIVGKKSTPTPVFNAMIEGVILNPWWEIPASIVRESVGALVRRNPALARERGYVWSNGQYRQRPGPNNALGQMKLVMPNRFSVYMHDTPNKNLFEEEVRAFSHGCIRTGDAIGYAATLLEGVKTREDVDSIVASGKTTTVRIARPVPVYITYFTAVRDSAGAVEILPDIYNRDGAIRANLPD